MKKIQLITVVIFVIIILGGLGVFFMNENNTRELTERISPPAGQKVTDNQTGVMTSVTSSDQRVSFSYPENWTLNETTGQISRGTFGPIVQSWSVQNYPLSASSSGVSDNEARVDIVIQKGGSNLPIETLVDCTIKTITCDKVGIDNEQFIRADSTLNTGMKTISVATFYDDKILKADAVVTPGQDQQKLTAIVNDILTSFKFSTAQ